MQATKPGKLEVVEKPIIEPAFGQVRIRVEACSVCHTDALTVEGPGLALGNAVKMDYLHGQSSNGQRQNALAPFSVISSGPSVLRVCRTAKRLFNRLANVGNQVGGQ